MRIHKRSSKKKYLYLISLVVVVIIAAIASFMILNKPKPESSATTNTSVSEPANSSKTTEAPSQGLPSNPTETTTDQVPVSKDLTVSITSFTQSNGIVESVAQSSGSGTCVFTYRPGDGGKPVTRQVAISDNICKASIPEGEFAYIGQWSLIVTFYSNSQKAEAQKNVSIS